MPSTDCSNPKARIVGRATASLPMTQRPQVSLPRVEEMPGQPCAVVDRHHLVVLAVPQVHRAPDGVQVRVPRAHPGDVVPADPMKPCWSPWLRVTKRWWRSPGSESTEASATPESASLPINNACPSARTGSLGTPSPATRDLPLSRNGPRCTAALDREGAAVQVSVSTANSRMAATAGSPVQPTTSRYQAVSVGASVLRVCSC